MTTRRTFTGALVAAGALSSFALVAGTHGEGSGNNGNPCNGHGKADQCHGNGAKADGCNAHGKADQCHGNGAKADGCNAHGKADQCHGNGAKADGCSGDSRMSKDQTPPPACRSAGGKEDHVE